MKVRITCVLVGLCHTWIGGHRCDGLLLWWECGLWISGASVPELIILVTVAGSHVAVSQEGGVVALLWWVTWKIRVP